jgi:hypothetical protein
MKSPQTAALSPLRDVHLRLHRFCSSVGHLFPAVGLLILLTPKFVWACACGCSIFDVGTPSLVPNGAGGTVWLEYDFQSVHQLARYSAVGLRQQLRQADQDPLFYCRWAVHV